VFVAAPHELIMSPQISKQMVSLFDPLYSRMCLVGLLDLSMAFLIVSPPAVFRSVGLIRSLLWALGCASFMPPIPPW
jgi:hypothetical protein